MKKTIALVLTVVMVMALAVPAFADVIGNYALPEIVIINGNVDGYNVPGAAIEYELTLHGPNASIIKIGNKSLSISDFKKLDSDTYIYRGIYPLGLTDSNLRFYVYDLYHQGKAEFEKVLKFKTDPTRPVLSVSGAKLANGFNIGIISIAASDNYGIDKIAVNGKTIADSSKINGKKIYAINHEVLAVGTYMVVVTDIAGNMSVANITFNADGNITVDSLTAPAGGSIWAGDYTTGIASLYKYNPQLYYYMRLYGKENLDDTWLLWYLLNQNNTATETALPSILGNPNWFYFYNNVTGNENMTSAEKFLYYSLFSGKLGEVDGTSYLWYLLRDKNLEMNPMLFYYILNGGKNPIAETNINENFLAYQYFFGDILKFVYGSEISHVTKDGVLTLIAPTVKEKSVSYHWQKYVNYGWQNTGSDSATLNVTPSAGDKYRVIVSSDYFYRPVSSDVLTVTDDMLADTATVPDPTPAPTPAPVPSPADENNDGSFTSDDIIFNGVKKATYYIRVKTGEKLILVPNVNGFWTFDTSVFTGSCNTLAVLTAQKAGSTVLLFTGTDGKGNTATKSIIVDVVD
jgi:hypothetical protein